MSANDSIVKMTSFKYDSTEEARRALDLASRLSGYVFGYVDEENSQTVTYHRWGVDDLPFPKEFVSDVDMALVANASRPCDAGHV
jgi:hypothetical protein